MITPDLSILNQLGTPMFYSDVTANRPAAGILGRIFIATDSPYGIFRDTGSSWVQIAGSGGGGITGSGTATRVAFWDSSSSISSNANLYWDNTNSRLGINTATPGVALDIHSTGTAAHFNGTGTNNAYLLFQNAGTGKWRIGNTYSAGTNYFAIYDFLNSTERLKITNDGQLTSTTNITASGSSTGYQGIYNTNTINIPASTTFPSGGYTYAGMNDYYYQIFAGNATFQNNNTNSAYFGINRIDFSGTGTITMTQATGVRAMSAAIFQNQYNGTASGTITHLAGAQILGFYRSAGSGTLSVTNAYGLIINNIDDYGAGFTYTNRWGIFQQGASDNNYFAGKVLIGTTTVSTYNLDVVGTNARINGITVGIGSGASTTNTAVGLNSMDGASLTGTDNTALGYRAGRMLSTGSLNVYIGTRCAPNANTGTNNVIIGNDAGNSISSGYQNTIIGSYAYEFCNGNNNVVIGTQAAYNQTGTVSGQFFLHSFNLGSAALELTNSMMYGKFSSTVNTQILRINARTGIALSADPDASAMFQIDSTSYGFLPPRMTTTQKNAIATPAAGLIVFDTTLAKLCVYSGSTWQTITSV